MGRPLESRTNTASLLGSSPTTIVQPLLCSFIDNFGYISPTRAAHRRFTEDFNLYSHTRTIGNFKNNGISVAWIADALQDTSHLEAMGLPDLMRSVVAGNMEAIGGRRKASQLPFVEYLKVSGA